MRSGKFCTERFRIVGGDAQAAPPHAIDDVGKHGISGPQVCDGLLDGERHRARKLARAAASDTSAHNATADSAAMKLFEKCAPQNNDNDIHTDTESTQSKPQSVHTQRRSDTRGEGGASGTGVWS